MSQGAREIILKTARSLGFERTVIASLSPMDAELRHYEAWLERGYAASMEYLKRQPHFRTSPQLLFPGSKSAIIVSVSYYTERPPEPPFAFGRVARYAVGQDYHAVLRAKLRELRGRVEEELGQPICGKAYTDDVALYEQAFAARHGVGFSGKNTMIIGPKLSGSYYFLAELFTDLELDADEPYEGTCGECFRCASACPTGAIVAPGVLDANRCISFLTIENKDGIPRDLRKQMGDWIFGCDVCQEVCPYNQRPPETPWHEFRPENGAGHYIDLLGLLQIRHEAEFRERFGVTPLRRPKRRGLLRNALVVLGNHLARASNAVLDPDRIIDCVLKFAEDESDDMLREHAAWALSQSPELSARNGLERMIERECNARLQDQIHSLMN